MTSCEEGYTIQYHFYGTAIKQCVSISTPRTLCLVALILSAVNVFFASFNFLKSYQGLKRQNESRDHSMFDGFLEAMQKFPLLHVIFTSVFAYVNNVVQFSLIYLLSVALSTGSQTSLLAAIASILVKALRARMVYFCLMFLNGFADDFKFLFPIPEHIRKSISKFFFVITLSSTVIIMVLYIVINQQPLDSPERIWMSELALVMESVAVVPSLIWSMVISWKLRSILYKHMTNRKEDGRREDVYRDFTQAIFSLFPMFIAFSLSIIPAIYPQSVNYIVPLKEITTIVVSYSFLYAIRKLYVHRDNLKGGNSSLFNKTETTGTNQGGEAIAPIVPDNFKMKTPDSPSSGSSALP